jgi:hypothetical protein
MTAMLKPIPKSGLQIVEDCWRIFATKVLPDEFHKDDRALAFVRTVFYAGVSFMFDVLISNCDDDAAAEAMLASIEAELDEHASELALASGIDIETARAAVTEELRRRLG